MVETVPQGLVLPEQVAHEAATRRSANGIAFSSFGDTRLETHDLERLVQAVPSPIAAQIGRSAYFFVPLAISRNRVAGASQQSGEETLVARTFTSELGEQATCHRNVVLGETDAVFISTRLLADRFALSFEFFIHVGHAFADAAGVPPEFAELAWSQAKADIRGETSQDTWEARSRALAAIAPTPALTMQASDQTPSAGNDRPTHADDSPSHADDRPSHADDSPEKLREDYLAAALADSVAIYLLSLAVDFDYAELRERDYPLLAPLALGARLKLVATLFPPNPGYEFAIRYRRRA